MNPRPSADAPGAPAAWASPAIIVGWHQPGVHSSRTARPRRRTLSWLAAACLSVAPAVALESSEWQYRQSVTIERAGIVRLEIPSALLNVGRPGLPDLRLIDPQEREVPFVLEPAFPTRPSPRAPARFEPTLHPGETVLRIATGADQPLAALVLASPARSFLKAARIEVSDDGERWRPFAAGLPLFRQPAAEQLRLPLPAGPTPHLRISIDDAQTPAVPFTGATLEFAPPVDANQKPLAPVRIVRREEFAGESLLTLDLGARYLPLAALELETPEPLFLRPISVGVPEVRDQAATERTLASGTVYRVAVEELPARAELRLPLEFFVPAREILLHIVNGDSPPITISAVRIQPRPMTIVFRASTPGVHRLVAGNPDVTAPRYDVSGLADSLRAASATTPETGPLEVNPGYRRVEFMASTPLIGAALDPSGWILRKPVQIHAAGVQQLELDAEVLARALPSLGDLRLVREGHQVPFLLERPGLSRAVPVDVAVVSDPKQPRFSRWQLHLPYAGLPITRVTVNSSTLLFQRRLRLFEFVTDERTGKHQRVLAEGHWSITPGMTQPLVLPLMRPPTTDRLFLETDNGDNPPIALTSATAVHPVVRLLFKSDPAPLDLYYGNRQAHAARYDLTLVAPQLIAAEKQRAQLGREVSAAESWARSALGAIEGGVLFWGVLALVVVALLVIVAKLLPKPPPA